VGWGPREIQPNNADWWRTVLEYGGPDHPALVGTVEIARALGRKPQTVRKLRMLGKLPPPVVVSGRLRWWRSDIQAWMLSRGLNPSSLSKRKLLDHPTTEPTT
jgi:predicted DNA-binding transcriptional regulator AlpA